APGLGGVAMIVQHYLPVSLSFIYFALNIPLFLIGFRFVGFEFILYSLIGLIFLSYFLMVFESLNGITNIFIGSILVGIFNGFGMSLVLYSGGSTGGLDIACVVLSKLRKEWTVGKIMILINLAVIIISGFIFGFEKLLLTFVSIYLSGKFLDVFLSLLLQYKKI